MVEKEREREWFQEGKNSYGNVDGEARKRGK